jgi:hypothetical protein
MAPAHTAPYSRADLKYDMQTGLIELAPLKRGTLDEEHVERQPPTEEQMIDPPSETEMKSGERGHEHVMRNASQLDTANAVMLTVEQTMEEADAHMTCTLTMPIWKASASAVNDETPGIAIEDVPLRKRNPGWSASFLIEKSLEFNKKYKSMEEQLLAYQPWDLCMAEKLSQHVLGVYKDEGITVKDAFNLGITPLRPSEAPILNVTPAGASWQGR